MKTPFLICFIISTALCAETLSELEEYSGITAVKEIFGLTGKGVTVVIHDGFDSESNDNTSHGGRVASIVKALAPGAHLINMTNIFLQEIHTTLRATPEIVGHFILEKYQPKIVNLSWGETYKTKFQADYGNQSTRKLLKTLAESGVAVVVAAGNDGELAGTNEFTRDQARFIDEINSDPNITGAIVLVGSGDVFSSKRRDDDFQAKNLLAKYSLMAGVSRNHFVIGGPNLFTFDEGDGEQVLQGTSFAAPVVSSVLALLAESFPQANGKMLVQLLLGGATKLPYIFERPEVIDALSTRLRKTTDYPDVHWRHMPWYDVFGRGVVSATGSVALGTKVFANSIPIFPKVAEPVIYNRNSQYIEKARSVWSIFDLWLARARKYALRDKVNGASSATRIIRQHLWPIMLLWPEMTDLYFSAFDKYKSITALAVYAKDFDLAFDIMLEGAYYLKTTAEDKSLGDQMLLLFTKNLTTLIGHAAKDKLLVDALIRLKERRTELNIQEWAPFLEALLRIK